MQSPTYVNESLGQCSVIDYFFCEALNDILDYSVLDPDINLSDHVPIAIRCRCFCQADSAVADTAKKLNSYVGIMQICWVIIVLRCTCCTHYITN